MPTLLVNQSAIIQLFQNLIGNAIKFRSEKAPIITIKCQKISTNTWEFKVSDNGVGMDEGQEHKAFLPFQRLNNTEVPGTGIGLAICKKVVNMHGGSISYTSTKGEGTTFIFTILQTKEALQTNKQTVQNSPVSS